LSVTSANGSGWGVWRQCKSVWQPTRCNGSSLGLAACGILVTDKMTAKKKATKGRGSEAAKPTRKQSDLPSVEWLASKMLEMDCEPERYEIERSGKSYHEVREAIRLKSARHILGVFASAQKAIEVVSGMQEDPYELTAHFTEDQIKSGLPFDDYAKYVADDSNCARAKRKLAVWIDQLQPGMLCFQYRLRSWHYDNATGSMSGAEWLQLYNHKNTRVRAQQAFIDRRAFEAFDNRGHASWAELLGKKKL